jgi:S1-C subfamily serine protease
MDDERDAPRPEEDPEAAIEAIADEPDTPPRQRRLARAAAEGVRQARRSAQVGIAAAALAALAAVAVAVLVLTGVVGGDDEEPETRAAAPTGEVVEGARRGAVLVKAGRGRGQATGAGVVVDARGGLVLTNFHVVGVGGDIEVGSPDDLEGADLKAAAPCEDLALLEVEDADGFEEIPLGSQAELRQGDPVVALGYPPNAGGTERLTATAGVVASVRGRFNLQVADAPRFPNVVQTDAALSPGNSGGPLVGADGRLVGINTVLITPRVGGDQGYALGVDRVKEVLGDLGEGRSRGWLGAGMLFPTSAELRARRLPPGVVVTDAVDGTAADDAGLEDVLITEIDGRRVGNGLRGYCDAVEGIESGDSRQLTVLTARGGRPERVTVEFE